MGRLLANSLVWILLSILGHWLVRRWGMYWYFGSAGLMTVALWVLMLRLGAALLRFHPRLIPARAQPRQPQRIRRVILEEERW